jgi:glycosyltransferase involved in cell wall biosynthesis
MKVLIFTPQLNKPGGVANYYSALKDKFSIETDYFIRGNRKSAIPVPAAVNYLVDYASFFFNLTRSKYSLYVINTSLGKAGCIRDSVFIRLCNLFNRKFIVFFRGWDKQYEQQVDKQPQQSPMKHFMSASSIIVLANEFKEKIQDWGYKNEMYVETTVVDSGIFNGVDFSYLQTKYDAPKEMRLLYLARVVKEKGIFELVHAFKILQQQAAFSNKLFLDIAGNGPDLENLKEEVKKHNIHNVNFLGHIGGEKKKAALQNSHFFLFPTQHGEGMPNSVLEAMAFGLPVLTCPVGGIKDFFVDGKMGALTESKDPAVYASLLSGLLSDSAKMKAIALYNHQYAMERFTTERVIDRLEKIFVQTINN